MKNKRIEKFKQKARLYQYPNRAYVKDGVRIYHDYSYPRDLTWWDDCGFIKNGMYHLILFTHPRHEYYEYCDTKAYDKVSASRIDHSFLDGFIPVTVKRGKSRKGIAYYEMADESAKCVKDRKSFHDKWEQLRDEYLLGDYVQMPFINVTQQNWCKQVQVCFPFEIKSEDDIIKLVNKVKEYLRFDGSFEKEWSKYAYTTKDWQDEN